MRTGPSGYFVDVQKRVAPVLRVVPTPGVEAAPAVSDEDIIQAFARRDRRAAALVYDHLVGTVDATLYRVVGRREADHDDLVQSAFEQIIVTLSRQSYAGGCSLRGWAASIACHVGLNAIRSRRRARVVFDPREDADAAELERAGPHDPEAQMVARTEVDRQKIALAAKAGVQVRDSQVKTTQAALASTREQLTQERRDSTSTANELRAANNVQNKELQTTTAQLEAEKQARLTVEAKLAGAMKDLAAIAAVKEEARGVVITLSGSVLFASGKYALLNTAMTKLDQVAEALKAQDADKRMVVEGHTDSQGSDNINQPLSLNRATAVRDYLVSRGVASEKISAIGLSSSKPITDNKTAENRANNRRVEIVIGASTLSTR